MKNFFWGLLALLAFTACDKEDEPEPGSGGNTPSQTSGIVGTWYEETMNEEDSYRENGTFYTVYSNKDIVGRIEGTYELKGDELTNTYTNYGQPLSTTFTIYNKTDKSLSLRSSVGVFHYGKVVDVVTMEAEGVGVSMAILSASGASVVSLDESLVKVDADGTLVGQGMKGTTYVRIADGEEKYYVKVVVDVNQSFYDLWYNYPCLFGKDEYQMRELMGTPASTEADGTVGYLNMQATHDYVEYVMFSFSNKKINRMAVTLKTGTAVNTVHSYLSARYYYERTAQTTNGPLYLYRSHSSEEQSEYLIGYYSSLNLIVYELLEEEELIPDYTQYLGMTRAELFASQDREPFSDEDGRITYVLDDNNIGRFLFFTFDGNNEKVQVVSLYLNEGTDPATVVDCLNSQFTVFEKGTAADGSMYAWINAAILQQATAGITYIVADRVISYLDLTANRSQTSAKNFGVNVDMGAVRKLSAATGRPITAKGEIFSQSLRSLR